MKNPLNTKNKKIIDYSFSQIKSPMLDIWLFMNCKGVISTATGLDSLSTAYNKPTLFINALPLADLRSYSNSIYMPKKLFCSKSNKELNLNQYFDAYFLNNLDYIKNNIKIVDLDEKEIEKVVDEYWAKITNKWIKSKREKKLEKIFWDKLKNWPRFREMHNWINPNSSVSFYFLDSKKQSFFNEK